jgi:hypothetical protein
MSLCSVCMLCSVLMFVCVSVYVCLLFMKGGTFGYRKRRTSPDYTEVFAKQSANPLFFHDRVYRSLRPGVLSVVSISGAIFLPPQSKRRP